MFNLETAFDEKLPLTQRDGPSPGQMHLKMVIDGLDGQNNIDKSQTTNNGHTDKLNQVGQSLFE